MIEVTRFLELDNKHLQEKNRKTYHSWNR